MLNEELKTKITELLPSATFEEGGEWMNINIESKDWLPLALQLRNDASLFFQLSFCLTCIDWKTHLTMVYHLSSTKYRHNIVIRSSWTERIQKLKLFLISGGRRIFMKEKYMKCLV
jgi:NADH:ubiquinone oxidoreductase subunit C